MSLKRGFCDICAVFFIYCAFCQPQSVGLTFIVCAICCIFPLSQDAGSPLRKNLRFPRISSGSSFLFLSPGISEPGDLRRKELKHPEGDQKSSENLPQYAGRRRRGEKAPRDGQHDRRQTQDPQSLFLYPSFLRVNKKGERRHRDERREIHGLRLVLPHAEKDGQYRDQDRASAHSHSAQNSGNNAA